MKTHSRERVRYVGLFLGLVILPAAIPVYLYVLRACVGVKLPGFAALLYDSVIGNGISYVWAVVIGFGGILVLRKTGWLNRWMILIPLLTPGAISLALTCLYPDDRVEYNLILLFFYAPGILLSAPCLSLISVGTHRSRGIVTIVTLTLLIWLPLLRYASAQFNHWLYVSGRVPIPYSDLSSLVDSWFVPSLIVAAILSCIWGVFYFRHRTDFSPARQ